MKEPDYIHFKNRQEFRNWLQKHHAASHGIWLIFFKKNSGKEGIKYNEALEEALCFGWIDSIIKKLDDNRYARKITPRRNTRNWSELNKKIVKELIKNGKMTQAGFEKLDNNFETGTADKVIGKTKEKVIKGTDIPDFIIEEFAKNEPSLENFNILPRHLKGIMYSG
jgi:uncharacterized protein YdeI (YjbR/CyaY-like superfamily)